MAGESSAALRRVCRHIDAFGEAGREPFENFDFVGRGLVDFRGNTVAVAAGRGNISALFEVWIGEDQARSPERRNATVVGLSGVTEKRIASFHVAFQEFNVKNSNLMSLFGRQLFSIIFILSSASHFKPPTIEYAARHGVPLPGLLVPLSGIVALVGGLSVLLGYRTRLGAWLLTLFLIPVTLVMHNFWATADASAFLLERALFLRNVALLGGALLIGYFGGGPLSLDALIHRQKGAIDPARTTYVASAARASQSASHDPAPVRQRATSRARASTESSPS